MPQTETVPLHDTPSVTEAAVSRRAADRRRRLAGAAAIASSTAQAQAPAAAPQMPAVQAPVRQEWLAKRTEEIVGCLGTINRGRQSSLFRMLHIDLLRQSRATFHSRPEGHPETELATSTATERPVQSALRDHR